jgi:hypothetical protein
MDPIVHEVEKSYGQQIDFLYFDTETASGQKKGREEGIPGVPTILLFDSDGERVYTLVGVGPRVSLEQHLQALLAQE